MYTNSDQDNLVREDASMTDKFATPKNRSAAETMSADAYLEWERVDPEETRLLLEEDTVYAEDLVRLGLSWQDFRSLVIRSRS